MCFCVPYIFLVPVSSCLLSFFSSLSRFLLFAKLRVFRWLYFFNVLYYVDWVMLFFLSLSLSLHFPLVFNGNHFRRQYVLSWYYSNCFESRCSSYTCRFFYFDFIFDFVCVFWGGFMCWGGIKKGRDWCMWGGGILYWILSRPHPTVSYFWRNKIKNQTKKENKSITIHSILVHLTLCHWFNLLLPPFLSFNPSCAIAARCGNPAGKHMSIGLPLLARPSYNHLTDDIKLGEETAPRWRTFNCVLVPLLRLTTQIPHPLIIIIINTILWEMSSL